MMSWEPVVLHERLGGGADAGLLTGPPCALWGKEGPLFYAELVKIGFD